MSAPLHKATLGAGVGAAFVASACGAALLAALSQSLGDA